MAISEKINALPSKPGVYIMRDSSGKIIYVGKSASLKDRVRSYFQESGRYDRKVAAMISNISDFDCIITGNEMEALILESRLIKKHKPKYNVLLKDDKAYPCIKITGDDFPRALLARRIMPDKAVYFGPYVLGSVNEVLKVIRKNYKIRDCSLDMSKKLERACLKEQVGVCSAPCIGKISKEEYAGSVAEVLKFLKGKQNELLSKLTEKMNKASAKQEFEDAAKYRDQKELVELIALQSGKNTGIEAHISKEHGRQEQLDKGAAGLKAELGISAELNTIEGIDISNTAGEHSVGSVVRFKRGVPDKTGYRKFRIKTLSGPDDTGMIKEVVSRRYKRARDERTLPDLVLIDGGKGQLGAALEALAEIGLSLPVISLAKREEEIFVPGKSIPLRLKKDSAELHLLQHIRDEAHRFAVKYHKNLRGKGITASVLDKIQ
ncbi:MAG: excinuclease ABC subunit UvrC [Candidatus Firestonebacteria bacterium]